MIDTHGPPPATPIDDVRLTVGVVLGPHGLDGELKLRLTTDDPEHLATIEQVFLGDEERPRRLLSLRGHGDQVIIRLEGADAPAEAQQLRGVPLRIAGADAKPAEPGEFFLYQLVGLTAIDENGAEVGRVTDVIETGAHDVFVITPPSGPDLLIPNHPNFVPMIEPEQGTMVVRPLVFTEHQDPKQTPES